MLKDTDALRLHAKFNLDFKKQKSRSNTKVEVTGQGSWSREEKVAKVVGATSHEDALVFRHFPALYVPLYDALVIVGSTVLLGGADEDCSGRETMGLGQVRGSTVVRRRRRHGRRCCRVGRRMRDGGATEPAGGQVASAAGGE